MAFEHLPIRETFSERSTWRHANRFQISPVKVLLRALDYSILLADSNDGIQLKLKVPKHLLPVFNTHRPNVILTWYDGRKLRFGCQIPASSQAGDPFLMHDESCIARSALDPDYRPHGRSNGQFQKRALDMDRCLKQMNSRSRGWRVFLAIPCLQARHCMFVVMIANQVLAKTRGQQRTRLVLNI